MTAPTIEVIESGVPGNPAIVECPNCGGRGLTEFYDIERVPVHSVMLLPTREGALAYPTGDIRLALCARCGFVTNVAFDPSLHDYSAEYEATQSFSPTFSAFSRSLASRLIERYDLRGKQIIEIGCGTGDFLALLCEMGGNSGVGFDPCYAVGRDAADSSLDITFIQDVYTERHRHYRADFVCCKMTLEHIDATRAFIQMVRRSIDGQSPVVFFQIPDAVRVFEDVAFWDVYYEHCSYFSSASLRYLFESCGFEVLDMRSEYDGQYLMIEALPSERTGSVTARDDDRAQVNDAVRHFVSAVAQRRRQWHSYLTDLNASGRKTVLWGGGSKGVAFLTTLGVQDEIQYAVDINPYKHGMYMAGTGQQIVPPEFLVDYRPDVVIVMNPIYTEEIHNDLHQLGLSSRLVPIDRLEADQ